MAQGGKLIHIYKLNKAKFGKTEKMWYGRND